MAWSAFSGDAWQSCLCNACDLQCQAVQLHKAGCLLSEQADELAQGVAGRSCWLIHCSVARLRQPLR